MAYLDLMSKRTHEVRDAHQRRALTSPIRLEILGLFQGRRAMSASDLADRMGRPKTAVYYHVNKLVEVGLLERVGERPGTKKPEALFAPIADEFDLTPDPGNAAERADALATLRASHRMAEGDLKAALVRDDVCYDGPARNVIATRAHAVLSPAQLAEANLHIDALLALFADAASQERPEDAAFSSLTLAFVPLRNRGAR